MNSKREYIVFIMNYIRCIPHIVIFLIHKNKPIILRDLNRELELLDVHYSGIRGLVYLLAFERAFRNIFYHRVTPWDFFLNIICPKLSTLLINCVNIGEGMAISHGFASAIGAISIGRNFTAFQQVTVGAAGNRGTPIIGNDVTVYAGAVIVGNIKIGNNAIIGANCTVYKDVPDNSVVLPNSCKVMRRNLR